MGGGSQLSGEATTTAATIYLIKSYIGPGCLALPYAMRHAGLWLGLGLLLLLCVLVIINLRALILCKQKLARDGVSTYPDLAAAAAGVAGRCVQSLGRHCRRRRRRRTEPAPCSRKTPHPSGGSWRPWST